MSRWLHMRTKIDRLLAAALLVPAAPLLAALAVYIRWTDGGPGLIALERVGQHGSHFKMWKLRTMSATEANGRAGGASITSGHDDRITAIGHKLRHSRMDELPQLWNVIRGDMALIGPRPETPEYVDPVDERWRTILAAKPGIAGPTQFLLADWEAEKLRVTGVADTYSEVILPVKMAVDEWYTSAASIGIDHAVAGAAVARMLGRRPRSLVKVLPTAIRQVLSSLESADVAGQP